jgi:hypothetical protein
VPAIISTDDSQIRASTAGRPYSLSHTAIATPTGSAIDMAMAVTSRVPSNGSRKPPVAALVLALIEGLVTNRSGRTYLIPWTRK